MYDRMKIQQTFEEILWSKNVYFQPPESIKMSYPCIVYNIASGDTKYADNKQYSFKFRYNVTLIDKNPDSLFVNKIMSLPSCKFDRHFAKDGLNHFVFNIYF